ncbi:uncharacterized protein N7459_009263 [Penicillium hispanicum]|uniref:uncharacterized protein n=1 Tax=Penicillium hispanicum TaxID=1080232 RepID=UPI0025417DB6|nr:uncharacterized protein N7459_009263 [Penicillium hispanicum]KAJ5569833.1 hypothetical protein N7459_009263 [Penicillium hispanicum]
MPASEDSRQNGTLPNVLSARSYLESMSGRLSSGEAPPDAPEFLSGAPTGLKDKSGPHLQREKRPILQELESAEPERRMPEPKDPLSPDRRVRKRGRPRLETAKDAAAIEERRLQIRRAQRTYRQKKEATIEALKTRVAVLEQTLLTVSDLLGADHNAVDGMGQSTIGPTRDDLARVRQLVLAEIKKEHPPGNSQSTRPSLETLRDVFGYQVSHAHGGGEEETDTSTHLQIRAPHTRHPLPRSPSPLLNRLFPTSSIYTYSYQEADLSRRLHRFCLEHTYRWLSDSHAHPTLMTRVFGLLPCIHDMPGVRRNFRRILRAEIGSPLEVSKLPFYTLGGAGTHFPRVAPDGEPIYPENMRRPGKILRRLARILRRGSIQDWDEDWSGDAEPDGGQGHGDRFVGREERLRALDLDGDWLDCRDIQGYLEHRGVVLDGSSVWLDVPAAAVGALYGSSPDRSASQSYASSHDTSPSDISGVKYLGQSSYVLEVECFFNLLLANMRVLGRAPGFRLSDVDVALRTTSHRRPIVWES